MLLEVYLKIPLELHFKKSSWTSFEGPSCTSLKNNFLTIITIKTILPNIDCKIVGVEILVVGLESFAFDLISN